MTEIRVDVDLSHPAERVWRAVTDPQILREWFMPVRRESEDSSVFSLLPEGQPGFDEQIRAEVVEVDRPRRIVTRWQAPHLHTSVLLQIEPNDAGGVRLSFVQRGFLGPQGALRRRALQRTYAQVLGHDLRAALDRMAASDRDREYVARLRTDVRQAAPRGPRNDARFGTRVPRQASAAWAGLVAAGRSVSRSSSGPGLPPKRRRPAVRGVAPAEGVSLQESPTAPLVRHRGAGGWLRGLMAWGRSVAHGSNAVELEHQGVAVAASVVMLVLAAGFAILIQRATDPAGPVGSGRVMIPGGVVQAPLEEGGAAVPSQLRSSAPPSVQPLTAAYRTVRTIVGGYEGVVDINNLTAQAAEGWQVVVVLPPLGLVVHDVRGAVVSQTERETEKTLRFGPTPQTLIVPPGESVHFSFQVQGVGAPINCTIEARACTGIPE